MATPIRIAAAAAVVGVLAVAVGITPTPPGPGGSNLVASPSPSAPGSASPSPIDTSTWTTYVSDRYGFSIGHPAEWVEVPADHTWTLAEDASWLSRAQERFHASDNSIAAGAWSVDVPPGTTADAWIAAYCPLEDTAPCPPSAGRILPVTVDGHPGSLVRFADDTQAFILIGDRMYVVAVWEPDSDPRTAPYGGATGLLEGYLSTMHLLPGGPALGSVPSPPPS